ncbi:hypothetical protein Bhyg_03706, partial [Pseudolycoriella hygida]
SSKPRGAKRTIPLVVHTVSSIHESEEDIEAQNNATYQLLRRAIVSNNDDISIQENETMGEPAECNVLTLPTEVFDSHLNEDNDNADDIAAFQGDLAPINTEDISVDAAPQHSLERQQSAEGVNETTFEESGSTQRPVTVPGPDANFGGFQFLQIFFFCSSSYDHDIIPIELDVIDEGNVTTRKRKRKQPFKDSKNRLKINVKQNMLTVSSTQRQKTSKDDCVLQASCLNSLSRKMFDTPNHTVFSNSMSRQFKPKSISDKLLQSFKRMTITRTEDTIVDVAHEFGLNQTNRNEANEVGELISPNSVGSIADVTLVFHDVELSLPVNDVSSVDSVTQLEVTSSPPIIDPVVSHQRMDIELSQAVREILTSTAIPSPIERYHTDSQKLFVSRSRQNK